jgi:cytidylate kinase
MCGAESETAVDQMLATFCHRASHDFMFKPSLLVDVRLMKDRNRRERKVGPLAAAHTASILDTTGAELGLAHCSV